MTDELFPNDHWKKPDKGLITLQALLVIIATAFVALRLYARISLHLRLAIDDVCIVLGLLLTITRAVVASLSTQSGWASRAGPRAGYQIPYYTHYFERRLFYALAALLIRGGVLTYYLRLFPRALLKLRLASWILLILSNIQGIQLLTTLGVYCNDIMALYQGNLHSHNGSKCSDNYPFTYSGAVGDAAIDTAIYLLPVSYVWGLRKLRLDQRFGLVFVFGIGLVAPIFAILQIPFIISNYRYDPNTDQSWFGQQVSTFIAVELALGLIASSLPDLRGLIARTIPGFMAAFKHRDDSSGRPCSDPGRDASIRRLSKPQHAQPGVVSIGGGVKLGGKRVGWGGKKRIVKKPYWMQSHYGTENSLWKDSTVENSGPPSRGSAVVAQPIKQEDTIVEIPTPLSTTIGSHWDEGKDLEKSEGAVSSRSDLG